MAEESLVDWGGHNNDMSENIGDMIESDYFIRKLIELVD